VLVDGHAYAAGLAAGPHSPYTFGHVVSLSAGARRPGPRSRLHPRTRGACDRSV